ncbi:MAG: hypothetical protein A2017_15195 [Lentisphaerae bacterium GWF2_44_16]|nr:MAG: hypothetical protein A2017_15195 [Lentisphaerae bacterium GWF2_44_16]
MNNQNYISLSEPFLQGNEKKYVNECLDSGWISALGKFVTDFERNFASYTGSQYAVAVVNGTSALHLALLTAGVSANDEVFIPTLTFIAPVNAISYANAHPVFIDIDNKTLGISPDAVEEFISENCDYKNGVLTNRLTGRKISAIISVHILGHSCRMAEIRELAEKYKLKWIEDAAEAIGTLCDGKHAGTFAEIGCFSFNGNKTLTTGGGGMLVTDNEYLAKRLRHLSTQAKSDELYYTHDFVGYNYRMSNIQAAIGLAQLEYIEKTIAAKREIQARYTKEFGSIEGISIFNEQPWCRSNCWLSLISFTSDRRADFISFMQSKGIQVRPLWELNNRHPMYKNCSHGNLSNAENLYEKSVCIPCSQKMTMADTDRVIAAVKSFIKA